MTSPLLGVPGSPGEREPGAVRGLATVKYGDDVHGECIGIEHDGNDLRGRCVCGHLWDDHHERDGCGGCALAFTVSCRRWPVEDRVLLAALRYDPAVHDYGRRSDFAAEIVGVLEQAGYRQIGSFAWGTDAVQVRVELAR